MSRHHHTEPPGPSTPVRDDAGPSEEGVAPLAALARGFRKRTWVTARLGAKLGRMLAKKTWSTKELAAEVDEGEAVAAAEALLAELDGLKGLVMKFGQMASYLNPSLPPAAQRVLARLQSASRPMAWEPVEALLREEFDGQDPDTLFESMEHAPFAAASIGQVHRARHGGRDVAVKVQYPGVDRLLESDLKTVGRLFRLFFAVSAIDTKEVVRELTQRMLEETDYRQEAENQQLFRRLLGDAVPEVVPERSTRRVITTTFAPGLGFDAFCRAAPQPLRNAAGERIFQTAFDCIFRHAVYNADPHPGNYLFPGGGEVVFLDFGCIKRFSPEFIATWKRVALSIINGDRARFPEAFLATGMVAKPRKFDFDYQWEMMQYIYQPFLSRTPFTYTHEYVGRSFDVLMFRSPNRFVTKQPGDWLFVNRLQWGLNSVLAHLNATAPWAEMFRAAVESDTVPAWTEA